MPGALRERLAGLTLAGTKTATFDLEELAIIDGTASAVGSRWTMVGTNHAELAVVEVTGVERVRLADVSFEMVDAEGESFRSVAHWRAAHESYWDPFLEQIRAHRGEPNWRLTDDTIVICERLRVVERMAGCDIARFPVVECFVAPDEIEWVSAELLDLDCVGIEEIEADASAQSTNGQVIPPGVVLLRAGFASDEDAVAAEAALDPKWQPRFEVLLGDEWLDAWREHFEVQTIGSVTIVGDWPGAQNNNATVTGSDGRRDSIVLRLDPARSFGTGAHPSTQLMIEAMQQLALHEAEVLDIGCGSGVLSVAALLLGAKSAHGTDTERAALQVTLENAGRNSVADRCTTAIALNCTDRASQRYNVVMANILAPVLIDLAPMIADHVRPGGVLLLSGLIDSQVDRVVEAFSELSLQNVLANGVWRCLHLVRC